MDIQPLERPRSLKESAYEELRRLILNRTLSPGQPVTEVALSRSLGISRTPIRQALSRLESEGLVAETDGRLQVRSITPKESADVAELRMAVEGHTARLLARQNLRESDLEGVMAINRRMESLVSDDGSSTDVPSFFQLNRDFHSELAGLTGNELLVRATEHALDLFVLGGLNALAGPRRASEVVHEHAEIVSAVLSGDPDLAYEVVSQHVFDHGALYDSTTS